MPSTRVRINDNTYEVDPATHNLRRVENPGAYTGIDYGDGAGVEEAIAVMNSDLPDPTPGHPDITVISTGTSTNELDPNTHIQTRSERLARRISAGDMNRNNVFVNGPAAGTPVPESAWRHGTGLTWHILVPDHDVAEYERRQSSTGMTSWVYRV